MSKLTQLERLIARIVALIEDNPGNIVTLTVVIDYDGIPLCWDVKQDRAEGLQDTKNMV